MHLLSLFSSSCCCRHSQSVSQAVSGGGSELAAQMIVEIQRQKQNRRRNTVKKNIAKTLNKSTITAVLRFHPSIHCITCTVIIVFGPFIYRDTSSSSPPSSSFRS